MSEDKKAASDICICLPFLRLSAPFPFARRLSPGLPAADAISFCPPGYPFSETEALAIFREFRNLSARDLESMRSSLMRSQIQGEIGQRAEWASLAAFAGAEKRSDPWELTRRLAQQILLWLLVMEENLAEIAALEAQCAACEARLPDHFREGSVGEGDLAERGAESWAAGSWGGAGLWRERAAALQLPMPWRVCVANAAIFLPEEIPLLLQGEMWEHVSELLDFGPARSLKNDSAFGLQEAVAPLWQVLGHSRPARSGDQRLERVYNAPRIWLGMEK